MTNTTCWLPARNLALINFNLTRLDLMGLGLICFTLACGDKAHEASKAEPTTPSSATQATATLPTATVSSAAGPTTVVPSAAGPTFYQDVLPLLESRCIPCHQAGGIAPFALDSLEAAKTYAESIVQVTVARSMPPWSASSDAACGTFRDSIALSDSQIETLSAWSNNGKQAGTVRQTQIAKPETLKDSTTLRTPLFTPQPQGTDIAENDEYRCFSFDAPSSATQFITGYSVSPGTPEIVHHLVAFIVNPNAPSDISGKTNGELMTAMDQASPERDGWPCFGAAGDGIHVTGLPAVWAPGQGVVEFPAGSGAPLTPKDKLVVQIHYNLEDPKSIGKTDQTELRLRLKDSVKRVGLFMVPDQFLNTYFEGNPAQLEPGKTSVKYNWIQSMQDLGLNQLPDLQLAGIMPHMHELGHKFHMTINDGNGATTCGVNVEDWDFHWQRMYFYDQPRLLNAKSSIQVSCDFDTSTRTEPVLPGWGTQNEMCAAILYVTAPIEAFQGGS